MSRIVAALLALLLVVARTTAGWADDKPAAPPGKVETRHTVEFAGKPLDYRAIAETFTLHDQKGTATGSIYTVAYAADVAPGTVRSVAFVFNGGPGAASVFLHLGALGPRILETPGDGSVPNPPYKLIDNPNSWLAFADLVFVDPIGTGFSRSEEGKENKDGDPNKPFWSVQGDLTELGALVRLWLTRHERWASPVYLVGESYGGYRAAALAQSLAEEVGVTVSGIALISPALDMVLGNMNVIAPMGPALLVPSYAATAAALTGKPFGPDQAAAAERFALGDYLTGLAAMRGVPEPGDPFVARVAATIGLPEDIVRRARGRVSSNAFSRQLLRDRQQVLSTYDGTVTRTTRGNPGEDYAGDPVLTPATAAFTAAFGAYAPAVLGYRTELPYRVLAHDVAQNWGWTGSDKGQGGLGLALSDLEQALMSHPQMKVLVVNGRHDLVTPYLSSRWLLDQLSVPDTVRAGIRLRVYDGGHMVYLHRAALEGMAKDAAEFFGSR